MKPRSQLITTSPFFMRGLGAQVQPGPSGQVGVELSLSSPIVSSDGHTILPHVLLGAMYAATELALSEAAPDGKAWKIDGLQASFNAPAADAAFSVQADLGGLDWQSDDPQAVPVTVTKLKTGGAIEQPVLGTATVIVR